MLYNFNLKMHVGKPSIAIVKRGDKVVRGERISKADEGISAHIHSSVTGVVSDVTSTNIIIEASENVNLNEYKKIKDTSSVVDAVFEAGVVGAGGAGFPTYIKLKTSIPQGTVLANCAECEPALEHNVDFLNENPQLIIKGIKYAMEATKATSGVIGIKSKHKKTIDILGEAVKAHSDISILLLDDMYPVGEERALIFAHSGKWLGARDLPAKGNYAVFNTETLANIVYAVEDRKPVIDKDITVVGDFSNVATHSIIHKNVPIGTPISHLIKDVQTKSTVGEIVIGGPYTGIASPLSEAYVTKMSGGVILTIEIPHFNGDMGLLVCACGGNEARLRDIATKMGANVVDVAFCKNIDMESRKCETPGHCPGQAQAVMKLRKSGASRLLISNCSDCSNTVMCSAPALGIGVYHATDHIFRTVGKELSRRLAL